MGKHVGTKGDNMSESKPLSQPEHDPAIPTPKREELPPSPAPPEEKPKSQSGGAVIVVL